MRVAKVFVGLQGSRINKTYSTGQTYDYLYDGFNILEETSTQYTGGNSYYLTGGIDQIFIRSINGQSEYLINDPSNSLRVVTNSNQDILNNLDYKPYGEILSGNAGNHHYLYTGREQDFIGQYYYRNRTFNALTGSFQQKDLIGILGGLNLYSYVNNNPINYIDPLGYAAVQKPGPTDPQGDWLPWGLGCEEGSDSGEPEGGAIIVGDGRGSNNDDDGLGYYPDKIFNFIEDASMALMANPIPDEVLWGVSADQMLGFVGLGGVKLTKEMIFKSRVIAKGKKIREVENLIR